MLCDADIFRAMMEIITMQALPEDAFVPPSPAHTELPGVLA
jgi:hypothetical protein